MWDNKKQVKDCEIIKNKWETKWSTIQSEFPALSEHTRNYVSVVHATFNPIDTD
jgi:hypothetical protein